jgi:hypothetical protein
VLVTKNIQKKVRNSLVSQEAICGDCEGFKCEVIRGTKLCKDQDVFETSQPCPSFTSSVRSLRTDGDEPVFRNVLDLARLIRELPDSKLRAVGVLLLNEIGTRNAGYNMGQKVFVRYRGRLSSNYLSNFMTAHIMSAKKDAVRLMSADGKICMTLKDSAISAIYIPEEFEPLRKQMVARGRFADPEVQKAIQKSLRCAEEYELGLYSTTGPEIIPTVDTVFKTNKIRKGSRTGDADLVAIASAIEKAHDVSMIDVPRSRKRRSSVRPAVKHDVTSIEI